MERMPGKQGGDQCAAPDSACDPAQKKENQKCVGNMEEQADRVMAGRIEAEQRAIQLVREPSEGMPVSRLATGKCPRPIGPADS